MIDEILRNRSAILAIVAEYYIEDDTKLLRAKIMRQDKRPAHLETIIHCEWQLWYDEDRNVVYV